MPGVLCMMLHEGPYASQCDCISGSLPKLCYYPEKGDMSAPWGLPTTTKGIIPALQLHTLCYISYSTLGLL